MPQETEMKDIFLIGSDDVLVAAKLDLTDRFIGADFHGPLPLRLTEKATGKWFRYWGLIKGKYTYYDVSNKT